MTVDANVILRYLLDDIPEQSSQAAEILEQNQIFIPNEVLAEVVYVLEKVYKVERELVGLTLSKLIIPESISMHDKDTSKFALQTYSEENLDIVDCLLFSMNRVRGEKVFTFDKKLSNMLDK